MCTLLSRRLRESVSLFLSRQQTKLEKFHDVFSHAPEESAYNVLSLRVSGSIVRDTDIHGDIHFNRYACTLEAKNRVCIIINVKKNQGLQS